MQKPSTIDNDPVISSAIELSASTWLAASKIAASEKTGAGAEVLMIDDVATTGGSILKAIEGMEGHGCYIRRALVVGDREEGVADNLAARNIQLAAIFEGSDFPEI